LISISPSSLFDAENVYTDLYIPSVITDGVIPSLHVDYKGTRIKQYHKEGQALRTETTINNARDFYIGKRLCNLDALRQVGFQANRRLLEVEKISHDCILTEEQFQRLHHSLQVGQQRVSALRFGDRNVQALWHGTLLCSSICCPLVSPTASFVFDWLLCSVSTRNNSRPAK
jgi:hypothetical protein